jgi:hypothetical protein
MMSEEFNFSTTDRDSSRRVDHTVITDDNITQGSLLCLQLQLVNTINLFPEFKKIKPRLFLRCKHEANINTKLLSIVGMT